MSAICLKYLRYPLYKPVFSMLMMCSFALQSCQHKKSVYQSDCNDDTAFKKVGFSQLIEHIDQYDQQYVEVMGTYEEAKEESALFNDSTFVDHSHKHALWINFSQDCPLYLTGTHQGLFQAMDGQFLVINNKKIVIRGKIDLHNKGHLKQYKGSLDRVSYVKL